MAAETQMGVLTGANLTASDLAELRRPCPAPAPLVVNGSPYVGCDLAAGHEGNHKVTIQWAS